MQQKKKSKENKWLWTNGWVGWGNQENQPKEDYLCQTEP